MEDENNEAREFAREEFEIIFRLKFPFLPGEKKEIS
jgi:hypothetical protein